MATGLASVDPGKAIDHYDLDDGDSTHPIYISYLIPTIPKPAAGIIKATLSWHCEAFRSTVALNPSVVGAGTAHKHQISVSGLNGNPAGVSLSLDVNSNYTSANDANTAIHIAGTFGPGVDNESTHTHPLSGSSAQAVTDGPTANVIGLSMDGRDVTAALGGPWTGDVIELDLSSVFVFTTGAWHRIALSLDGLGRLTSLFRIYYTT